MSPKLNSDRCDEKTSYRGDPKSQSTKVQPGQCCDVQIANVPAVPISRAFALSLLHQKVQSNLFIVLFLSLARFKLIAWFDHKSDSRQR